MDMRNVYIATSVLFLLKTTLMYIYQQTPDVDLSGHILLGWCAMAWTLVPHASCINDQAQCLSAMHKVPIHCDWKHTISRQRQADKVLGLLCAK